MNVLATQLNINSGITNNGITGNSFSNGTVVASGDSTAKIDLSNNFWGTTNTTLIANKITDQSDNPSLPTVNFTRPSWPPARRAWPSRAVANNPSAIFSAADQTVTLTANVTSGTTNVNEGTVMFTILNGINMIGKPLTVAVANGVATTKTSYSLPGGTAAGTYTIQAIYLGTGNYLGSIDASHALTVASRATNTAVPHRPTRRSSASRSSSPRRSARSQPAASVRRAAR